MGIFNRDYDTDEDSMLRHGWIMGRDLCSRVLGIFLLVIAVAAIPALLSFSPSDPSLNTIGGDNHVHNWLGHFGSTLADGLWQWLGLGALLFVPYAAISGWRRVTGNKLRFHRLRGLAAFAALLGFAAACAEWGGSFGFGVTGRAGGVFGDALVGMADTMLPGPLVPIFIGLLVPLLSLPIMWIALGFDRDDWAVVSGRAGDGMAISLERSLSGVSAFTSWWQSRKPLDHPSLQQPELSPLDASALNEMEDDEEETEEDVEDEYEAEDDEEEPAPRKSRKIAVPKRRRGSDDDGPLVPPTDLLQAATANSKITHQSAADLKQNAQQLTSTLQEFGVQGQISNVRPGPIVTLYELEPAPGTRAARIVGLSDDIARQMCARAVRVAVVPGRNAIGIELPNLKRETIYLRELLEHSTYNDTGAALPLTLGKDIGGAPVIADLARMPHLLVAGTTGSGKSVAINAMILSLLYKLPPEKCRLIMIDPKMLELSVYEGIPHLLTPVVTEPKKAVLALKWAVREMEDRYRAMSKLGVRNIDGYNARLAEARDDGEALMRRVQTGFDPDTGKPVFEDQPLDLTELPYIVVIVDEMADLMLVAGKDIEAAIQRLAQMARAAGIHLIMATQRPSVDVITGTIKANFPTRISFQVTSKIDSRTILGEQGAEQLLGQGDMLYMAGASRVDRVHGPFVRDDEVEKVVKYLKQRAEPIYIDAVTEEEPEFGLGDGDGEGSGDELYDRAVALIARERKASTSFIQRHLQIGYNRAARIMDQMEAEGVVSSPNHVGKREILLGGSH